MTEFLTAQRDYFRTQQTIYISSNPKYNSNYDLEVAVLATKLSKPINEVNVPSDWRLYFLNYGYTDAFSISLSSLWFRWLTEKGFTRASLRGKFKALYDNGMVDL